MNKNNKSVSICSNRIYEGLVSYLFPTILVLVSFIGVNRGIDCTDTTYNLGNYSNLSTLDPMWYYSTLFSNFVGWLLVHLPGGASMLGVNIYAGIIKASFGLFSYFFFTGRMGFYREVVFLANVISFGLWWIPNAGLYHYLSFYLFAIAAVLLYEGLFENNDRKLVIAGVVLAINVFVRFPNLVQAGMIVAVWWFSIIKRESFKRCMERTGKCFAGYMATLVIVFGIIGLCGKLGKYINSIRELFAMTGDAKKYGSVFMLVNLFNSYTCVWYYMIPIVMGLIGLFVIGFLPERIKPFGHGLAVAGFLVVYYWEYTRPDKLFDYNFRSYSSIYLFMVVMAAITMAILFLGLFMKGLGAEVRVWCMLGIVIQLITPIGSNNSLYAVMNNMFFGLPVALYVLTELRKYKGGRYIHSGLWTLFLLFMVQAVLFRSQFAFRDGFLGESKYGVTNNKILKGMVTEEVNAEFLTKMTDFWQDNNLSEYSLITFGNIPGYGYVFGSKPALSSTWITLDSYSSNKLSSEIESLESRMAKNGERVVVAADSSINDDGIKQEILKNFLKKYSFIEIYNESGLQIWIQEE